MVRFSGIWVETEGDRCYNFETLALFDHHRRSQWDSQPIPEKLRSYLTFSHHNSCERSWERFLSLPHGSLSGIVLVFGTTRETSARLACPINRGIILDPETSVELLFTRAGIAHSMTATPQGDFHVSYPVECALLEV